MNIESNVKKVKNEEKLDSVLSNSSIIMLLLLFLIIVLALFYFLVFRFKPYQIAEYSGYAVSGNKITENLLNKKFNDENDKIKAIKVEEQDMIYKRLNSFYVGKSTVNNINLDYPIYINDNIVLYNLSEDVSLITKDFLTISGRTTLIYTFIRNKI